MSKIWYKRKTVQVIIIIGVVILPLLYSYLYLGAFWDPYSTLNTLPVAVVNNDDGAVINGETRNLGQELCNELNEDNSLKFIVTDENTAKSGTDGNKYYAMIVVPSDFSADVATASETDKQTATITFSPNEKRNFLASQILSKATLKIEESLRSNVNEEITAELSSKLQEVPQQLSELQDGLNQLNDGASKLTNGTGQLVDGSGQLADGTKQLVNGSGQLVDGSGQLVDGSSQLVDGSGQLTDGSKKLADGTEQLVNGSGQLVDGTEQLADGTGQLVDGASQLADGTSKYSAEFNQYQAGVTNAASGSSDLSTGAGSLDSGIDQLLTGATALENSTQSLTELQKGANDLAAGASSFNTNLIAYTDGVSSLITNVKNTGAFLTQYVTANQSLMSDPTFAAFISSMSSSDSQMSIKTLSDATANLKTASATISAGISQLASSSDNLTQLQAAVSQIKQGLEQAKDGSSQLVSGSAALSTGMSALTQATGQLSSASEDIASGAATLNDGAEDVNSGAKSVNDGATTLNSGAAALNSGALILYNGASILNNGASVLADGATTLNAGTINLNTGIKSVNDGANDLNDGINTINGGAETLQDGISTAKDGVDSSVTGADDQLASLNGLSDYAAEPVTVETENINPVPNYGTAFAPYFLSLSLWVGAIIIFVGIFMDIDNKFKLLSRDSDKKILRTFAYLLIGFTQAVVLAIILKLCLGLQVNNMVLYFASCCLVSVVFLSIVQFLMVFLGDAGKFLSLVLLILQLTSCGGTFPMETVPKFFNILYPYMPMTYSVNLFKEAISGGDSGAIWSNTLILLSILIVFTALTLMFSKIKSTKNFNKPQLTFTENPINTTSLIND